MRHVIVGSGVAGVSAAIELTRRQAEQVQLYTAERHPYYFRPRLSHFLAGEISQDQLFVRPASWYEDRGIQMHLGARVVRLMPEQNQILLADHTRVHYDRLLLATGSVPFVPPVEGADQAGVFTLRTLDDVLEIRAYAAHCQHAVVIGGGLLGLEAARGLKASGLAATVLEFFPRLLPRQLDDEGAAVFQGIVEGLGVAVAVGANTRAILGDGRVRGVLLHDGREFPAQMVLVAAGVRCNAELAADAGLHVQRGVVVDERMSTSAEGVYCAGDAASFLGHSWGIVPVAQAQARVAAANMVGEDVLYEEIVPSTTLHIVGVDLTSIGTAVSEGEELLEIRRSDPPAGLYKKLVLEDGLLVGAIVIGDRALAKRLEGMVAGRAALSREKALALVE